MSGTIGEDWTEGDKKVSPSSDWVENDAVELNPDPDHVISFVHGIRDLGLWSNALHQDTIKYGYNVAIEIITSGWIDPFTFLTRLRSRSREDHVLLELNGVFQKFPKAKHSILAHSYGADMVSRVIHKTTARYEYIFLCGSVSKENPYSYILNLKSKKIFNDCSTKDLWPVIACCVNPWCYQDTGTHGFRCSRVTDRFWEEKHGYYTSSEHFFSNVLPLIVEPAGAHGQITYKKSQNFGKIYRISLIFKFTLKILMFLLLVFHVKWIFSLFNV